MYPTISDHFCSLHILSCTFWLIMHLLGQTLHHFQNLANSILSMHLGNPLIGFGQMPYKHISTRLFRFLLLRIFLCHVVVIFWFQLHQYNPLSIRYHISRLQIYSWSRILLILSAFVSLRFTKEYHLPLCQFLRKSSPLSDIFWDQ